SEEHTSELQSLTNLVCRLLLEKKKKRMKMIGLMGHARKLANGWGWVWRRLSAGRTRLNAWREACVRPRGRGAVRQGWLTVCQHCPPAASTLDPSSLRVSRLELTPTVLAEHRDPSPPPPVRLLQRLLAPPIRVPHSLLPALFFFY